jgi:Mrp family chromosome partitioning ATPase
MLHPLHFLPGKPRGDGMKEIVVISGKGGTGKTSLAASFAASLAGRIRRVQLEVRLISEKQKRHGLHGFH